MFELLIPVSCFFFLLALIPGRHRILAGIIAWITIIIVFIGGLPSWVEESNILYPVMAVLSIPFLIITIRLLLKKDNAVISLTRAAGVAFIIYAPFAFIEAIGNFLIATVISHTYGILQLLGYPVYLVLWNTFQSGFFRVEIILACTGIQAIAIMLGVASAVPTTIRQKCLAFLLIVPTIYILNLFRNAGVIITYTSQLFAWLPDISGNPEYGYSSFFWAHNIFAEGIALIFLVVLAYSLFRLIPSLGDFARALVSSYENEFRSIVYKDTQFSEKQKDEYKLR
ncbi:MAG TPA: archaeosortase A [Methanospirillum sp.]|uniref:archaeosortase A n=1 Tax=Methanospirillum sp. TaxID=45200 RepID=UPI002BD87E43|nr:archaeosortase A [Methanospirillum sp.]HOJ96330.1 archaeosortase A [Methanospirillum sp.]HPP77848.1 archaeosortase A [Methanospirillum sp.]